MSIFRIPECCRDPGFDQETLCARAVLTFGNFFLSIEINKIEGMSVTSK